MAASSLPSTSNGGVRSMKNRMIALGGLATLLVTTATYGVVAQQSASAAPTGGTFIQQAKMGKEHHPELRKALRALNNAKNFLQSANTDFGGRREKALDLTQKAIEQVKDAIAYDKH